MHRFLLHNDSIRETTEPCLLPGQVGFLNGWGVFTTLRVTGGVLFEWERHWARMLRDAQRLRVPVPQAPQPVLEDLQRLIDVNGAHDATLRLAFIRNRGGLFEAPGIERPFETIAFTTDLRQWGTSVRLALKPNARHGANEFRGAKLTSWAQNLAWHEEAHERGFDEVLLLDEFGRVSECTSANIFAVSGSEAITPPLSTGCLPGITREVLLEAVTAEGMTVREGVLLPSDLESADFVFITSTTRDLLAVSEIEGLHLRGSAGVPEQLSEAFRRHSDAYCAAHRRQTVS